jgi:hypothetical protein
VSGQEIIGAAVAVPRGRSCRDCCCSLFWEEPRASLRTLPGGTNMDEEKNTIYPVCRYRE